MEDKGNEIKQPKIIKVRDKEYSLYNKIDNGSYGKVNLIKGKVDKKEYALKILTNNKYINDFESEIEIFKYFNTIKNTYIPKFYASDKIKINSDENLKYVFIMDYLENNNLFYYIENSKNGIPEEYAKYIFKRIVQGIQFCHNNKVCHLDIKPENIVLNEEFDPMIVDFGFAKQLPELKKGLKNCSEKRGTQYYKSPEMYIEEGEISGIDADIFSLGTVLMLLVSKRVYFYLDTEHIKDKNYPECLKICSMKTKAVRNSIMNNKKYSPELKNLYLRMISIEPNERPSLEEVLKDPLLKEINEIESDEKNLQCLKKNIKII